MNRLLDYWMNRCPIKKLEEALLSQDIISNSEKVEICEEIDKEIEEALIFAKESPYPDQDELTSNVFKV